MRRLKLPSLLLAWTLSAAAGAPVFGTEPSALQPELKAAKVAEAAPVAATPAAKSPESKPVKLDVEVTALLRRTALALENRAIEPEEQAGFHALITAGDLLREDKTLAPSERERLRALCRVRLAQAEEVLKRQTAKETKEAKTEDGRRKVVAQNAILKRPTTVVDAPANQTLAQQLPGGFGGAGGGQNPLGNGGPGNIGIGPAANRASAEALMEIITTTIKPESWEENGGKGVIRYFQLGHGMVIRATADVHGDLGNLVGQLRK